MKDIFLSVIIPCFDEMTNLQKGVLNKVSQFLESRDYSYEVIVVDNDPTSLSIAGLQGVTYVKSSRNGGYGYGNNLGAKYAKGEYLLILNPDTRIVKDAIDQLVKFLDKNKNAGIVAPNLIDIKGKIFRQLSLQALTPIRAIFSMSFVNNFFPRKRDFATNKPLEVEEVPGSAFLIRSEVFEKAGMFDENIFMYFEESDIGKRVRNLNYKIFVNPKAEVLHYWYQRFDEKRKKIFEKSRFYYFKKHYGI